MKSLIKKIFNTNISKKIRNNFNYKPIQIDFSKVNNNTSVSDGFIWRTDNKFVTIFKFTDLLKLFYKINESYLDLYFYDNKYRLIKKLNIKKINLSNEIIIDKNFLNGYEGFGILFLFHKYKEFKTINKSILSNRCYLGFSHNNSLPSFVYGNTYVISENISSDIDNEDLIFVFTEDLDKNKTNDDIFEN